MKAWCGVQMATLDKAEALLEDLRSASWDAAVKDLEEVKAFATKQVNCSPPPPPLTSFPTHHEHTSGLYRCVSFHKLGMVSHVNGNHVQGVVTTHASVF